MSKAIRMACGVVVAAAVGCSSGTVSDQKQTRDASPDGRTATQTRTQMRTTPSGAQVRETETQTREVVQPGQVVPDATQRDAAKTVTPPTTRPM